LQIPCAELLAHVVGFLPRQPLLQEEGAVDVAVGLGVVGGGALAGGRFYIKLSNSTTLGVNHVMILVNRWRINSGFSRKICIRINV
jgi:hypothetical protein